MVTENRKIIWIRNDWFGQPSNSCRKCQSINVFVLTAESTEGRIWDFGCIESLQKNTGLRNDGI